MKPLSVTSRENISETLKDFKSLLSRFREVKEDSVLLRKFCSRNRNPLWDISNSSYFHTGLFSNNAINSALICMDHYIQRSKAVELIFKELDKCPDMGFEPFLALLKKYCGVVGLTKEEHSMVTSYCKRNSDVFNYEAYLACNIQVKGLSELILS